MSSLLSIEFTETEAKVVLTDQAKNGSVSVKSLSVFDLPNPEDAAQKIPERAQALRDHLKAQRITVKSTVVVIPKNFVMARSVTLPSVVDDEIAGMARFEADRHIPFNAERHVVSYHVLAKQGMQGSDVLLAAVDRPIAQEYLDICIKAGLEVSRISVSSITLFNAFAAAEKTAMADRTVLILNVGRNATDLVIATNGNLSFTRGSTTGVGRLLDELSASGDKTYQLSDLPQLDALEPKLSFDRPGQPGVQAVTPGVYDVLSNPGEEDIDLLDDDRTVPVNLTPPLTDATQSNDNSSGILTDRVSHFVLSDWLNKLLEEVRRTYEFANREFNCPMVNHIYLAGEGATIKRLSQLFQANFNVDAAVFDPLHGAASAGKAKKLELPPQIFANAIGGAIGRQPHTVHINLLPGSYTEARTAKRQQVSYIVTGILALIALVIGYVYLSDAFATKRELLYDIQQQNKKDQARVKDLTTKKERLRIIKENVQDDKGALNLLRQMSEKPYFPDTVSITSFDYKRGDYMKLSGNAKDLPAANQLVNDMRNTGFFENAQLDSTEPNKILRGRPAIPVLGFNATFTFPKPKKVVSKTKSKSEDEEDGLK